METLPKTLEENVKTLVGENKIIEAVSLVQRELQLGLKKSKDIVDTYRPEITSNLTPEKIQNTMKSFLKSLEEENKSRISVKIIPKEVIAETTEQPVFVHPQIKYLYEYAYDIPLQHIEEIKALPRETLLKNLKAVLYDSIARYHFFSEGSWDVRQTWFPLHALFLMRELKATELLEPILDFLSQSEELIRYWVGDFLTEDIWSVIAMCGSDQLPHLKSFMLEPGRYTWCRSAVAEAVNQLALHERIPKQDGIRWIQMVIKYYLENRQAKNLIDSDVNGSLIAICLDLQAKELLPLIKQMLDGGIASKMVAGDYETVVEEMNRPLRSYAKRKIQTIKETYEEIIERDNRKIEKDDDVDDEYENYEDIKMPEPYVRPEPKIGRNDPCPCGSGKKYKKCHGINN